jgi:hypothetical protein
LEKLAGARAGGLSCRSGWPQAPFPPGTAGALQLPGVPGCGQEAERKRSVACPPLVP